VLWPIRPVLGDHLLLVRQRGAKLEQGLSLRDVGAARHSGPELRYVDGGGTVVTPGFVGAQWQHVTTFAVTVAGSNGTRMSIGLFAGT
jgi:hypothetical protein